MSAGRLQVDTSNGQNSSEASAIECLMERICLLKADVIAFGESVHGSASLHRAMYTSATYLIKKKRIARIGFEMPSFTMDRLNLYITNRSVENIDEAFQQTYAIFRDQDLRNFIIWLRNENRIRLAQNERPVEIFGFDIRDPWISGKLALENPAFKNRLTSSQVEFLTRFSKPEFYAFEALGLESRLDKNIKILLTEIAKAARATLLTHPGELYLTALDSGLSYFAESDGSFYKSAEIRDRGMYNMFRIQSSSSQSTLLIGHLFHLARNTHNRHLPDSSYRMPASVGQHIAESKEYSYVAVGFSFCEGQYLRTPEDIPRVQADENSLESLPGCFFGNELRNIPHSYVGKFNVIEGNDSDDSRVPLLGPAQEVVNAMIILTTSELLHHS